MLTKHKSKKLRRPKIHTIVFYALYIVLIVVFFKGVNALITELDRFLVKYEASQPDVKTNEIFDKLFSDPDWEAIYEMAGITDTVYDGKSSFAVYMKEMIGNTPLKYVETSAGLSGGKKFFVRADDMTVASFSLIDSTDGKETIPKWELSTVEAWATYNKDITVYSYPDFTVYVNGIPLNDSHVIMSTQTRAEDYLPDGIHGQRSCCYYLDGLMIHPQIVIKDQKGVPVELTYNESTNSYSHTLEKNYLTFDQRKAFEDSSEIYGRYMIKNIKKSELGNYFVDESYNDITKANVDWMQSFTKYEFGNTLITEYYGYTPSYCSARIDRSLFVTRKNGTVKEYKISSTFFLEKRSDGWKVVKMTNENMSEIITEVRITFYSDDKIVQNETINANVHELYFPIIESTEGKTFSGWFTKSLNDKGETVMTLTFKPDENGKVTLPDDYTLKPMKLYAVFE